MKAVVERLNIHPSVVNTLRWGKLISVTGGAQILVQGISFISGIMIIRLLPTGEYALYTLANAMLANMLALADGGITSGVTAQGGKVWSNREELGIVLATGFELRRKFALLSMLLGMPLLFFLCLHHDANWLIAALVTISIVPSFYLRLSGTLLEISPKLHQDILGIQKVQVSANIARLLLAGLSLLVVPWAYVGVLVAAVPEMFINKFLRKATGKYANPKQDSDPVIRKKILTMVKRLFPEAIYICVSSQLTIWLISIFGSTAAVAQLGALSRVGIMLTPFTIMFASVIMPRFARLPNDYKLLMQRYLQIQTALVFFFVLFIGGAFLFAKEILWVLGEEYKGLTSEVVLLLAGSCIYVISHSSFSLCTSKGWVINPLFSIPINVISIATCIAILDVSSLSGILLFTIIINSVQVLMHVCFGLIKINKLRICTSIA
ncbi:lipopolysaccharide biosynthesis protein [Pontibacter harenae]|uniref:lipopolysaccharide biosynthesis protein n=1 Tax=Pontibacter harenae TaxID=2894083 RepID=UPI001E3B8310|nr:polysaccharide biosynthesis protein [Pontibacter harenae]MCC9167204.1 polysaccharide biosynthesis protein [Pontibacter harenae]